MAPEKTMESAEQPSAFRRWMSPPQFPSSYFPPLNSCLLPQVSGLRCQASDFRPPASVVRQPMPESGQAFALMLVVILPVLILVLGVAHDLGNAAVAVTVAQNAADLAAAEAGKLIDAEHFAQWGEVELRPEAVLAAQTVAADLSAGKFQVDWLYLEGNLVVVEGRVTVHTPFLGAFLGRPRLTRQVQGVARAAHGAEFEGE